MIGAFSGAPCAAAEEGEEGAADRPLMCEVADYAASWVGRISYRLGAYEDLHEGGESDCSWFLFHVFNDFGLLDEWQKSTTWGSGSVPGTVQVTSIGDAQPGDVLFWEEGYNEEGVLRGHVVMYIGAMQVVGCNGSSPTTGAVMRTAYKVPGGGREPDSIWRLKALDHGDEKLLFGLPAVTEPISGHLYVLALKEDLQKVLYVHVKKKKNSVPELRAASFSGGQKGVFRFDDRGDGSFRLTSYFSDLVLGADGDELKLSEDSGYPSQSFRVRPGEDGSVKLVNEALGDVVAVRKKEKHLSAQLGQDGIAAEDADAASSFYLVDVTGFYE